MSSFPLSLGVRRGSDAKGVSFSSRSKYNAACEKALQRDNHTCQCCGFRAERYQRVVPVAGELRTLCFFCEGCLMLDVSGMAGAGILIWLPEISQAEVNHLARAIYVARASGHKELAAAANRALEALTSRRADAKRRLGADDPLLLATVFLESLTEAEYKSREAQLEGIRYLPLDKRTIVTPKGTIDVFPKILAYWRSAEGPFGKLPVEKWESLFSAVG